MASQDMIKAVKLSLRLTADVFDSEISMLIDSCTLDLQGAGVSISSTNSALITQAIVFYCKGNFGDGDDRFIQQYEKLRDAIANRKGIDSNV
jgi:hypothetical protein|uniref:DNA-packaging protein n=1 Tax=Siphoviridae sp. ctOrJ23 TaxID=2825481 RepID=A0A8S5Q1F3_9CAUD|nr:MAG TPA: hypothetical protein [Siphoviridae sp. ctOrJ23]